LTALMQGREAAFENSREHGTKTAKALLMLGSIIGEMGPILRRGHREPHGGKVNTQIIALTCALVATACGGADTRPAQDPASGSTAAAPSDSSTTVASATDPTATAQHTTVGTTTTTTGKEVTGATPNVTPHRVTPTAPGVADETKNADNAKTNERDRHGALTPMDQGSSGSETKITATIREAMIGDKTLSFTAKNVKVITVGTKVTLRGPVKSAQEKAAIEAIAKQTAGVSDVDNQLEVKK
jgi:osmotically-inducible protein OsmY